MIGQRAMACFWLILAPVAFALHLLWEYLQCEAFFIHGGPPGTGDMLRAALGDLVLTGIAYLGTAAVARNWNWPLRPWRTPVWLSLLGMALVLSTTVEWHALAMDWWRYTAHAPLLPLTPISVLPVLQLVLLLPLSFGIARRVALKTTGAMPAGGSSGR